MITRVLDVATLQPGRFVTVSEASQIARVSRRTLYAWMNAGKLPFVRTISGTRRIDRLALLHPDTVAS